ncbi:hypothetical protein mvi_177 [Megavirus vitis]|uniref:Uncharacterized protein n=2 Tax=unclassified Megavirus TaxID=3068396 RepID=A0A2K9V7F1_9VIRU|nr:hypothetical protein c7_L203 [Megavirus courdo7]AUV58142.1 hypothetical protein [Bandra megavirus]AVL93537.1 hypothetical protein mvi_177 [Megavirus vitis]
MNMYYTIINENNKQTYMGNILSDQYIYFADLENLCQLLSCGNKIVEVVKYNTDSVRKICDGIYVSKYVIFGKEYNMNNIKDFQDLMDLGLVAQYNIIGWCYDHNYINLLDYIVNNKNVITKN